MGIDASYYQISMLIMLLLFFVIVFFLKKSTIKNNNKIKVISMLSLGVKEKIALIDVDGARFVVGVTSHTVNKIHHFDEDTSLNLSESFKLQDIA